MSNLHQKANQNVSLENQIELMRKELKNIRAQMRGLKELHKKEVLKLKKTIEESMQCKCSKSNLNAYDDGTKKVMPEKSKCVNESQSESPNKDLLKNSSMTFRPIGRMKESWFTTKNGTPRQPTICRYSKGTIDISEMEANFSNCSNPQHAIENLSEFSHIWIIFYFDQSVQHQDTPNPGIEYIKTFSKTKVAPPRLGGQRVGLFSTRSPHRPNLIGLTLGKIESVIDSKIHVSGIDLLQGTPILDIKPYIPHYDMPPKLHSIISAPSDHHSEENELINNRDNIAFENTNKEQFTETLEQNDDTTSIKTPCWVENRSLKVIFSQRSINNINSILQTENLNSKEEMIASIVSILQADPRSSYRKSKCNDRLYYFSLNKNIHITAWFDDQSKGNINSDTGEQDIVAEVLKVQLLPTNADASGANDQ